MPNQGDFAVDTIGSVTTEYLAVSNTKTKAFMPIPHALYYRDTTHDIVYTYPAAGSASTKQKYTCGSAWFYRPTTGAVGQYRYFRLVLGGVFRSTNDGATPPASFIADYGGAFAPALAADASIQLQRVYLCALHLRGS